MRQAKAPKKKEASAGEETQSRGEVALRAPKDYAAIGIPIDGDETLQVKVPKNGIVRVSREIAGRLMQEGFTRIETKDED